jgi:hypothetical protein
MSQQFILGSLTKESRDELLTHPSEYMIPALPPDNYDIGLGSCLLKGIIPKSIVDILANKNTLRMSIINLPRKIFELQSNVKQFNMYVTMSWADCERTHRYRATYAFVPFIQNVSNEWFVSDTEAEHSAYIKGNPIDADTLMSIALQLLKFAVDDMTEMAPSKSSKKVIAMQAKLDSLKQSS